MMLREIGKQHSVFLSWIIRKISTYIWYEPWFLEIDAKISYITSTCLLFKNWIQSVIICINDIQSENGRISEHVIFKKLQSKRNWMAEFNILKNSLPTTWIQILKSDNSIRLQVKIYHSQFYDFFSNRSKQTNVRILCKQKIWYTIHKYWAAFLTYIYTGNMYIFNSYNIVR